MTDRLDMALDDFSDLVARVENATTVLAFHRRHPGLVDAAKLSELVADELDEAASIAQLQIEGWREPADVEELARRQIDD